MGSTRALRVHYTARPANSFHSSGVAASRANAPVDSPQLGIGCIGAPRLRRVNDEMTGINAFRNGGFTIVEIMVTLAVAAVLLGLALPAYNGFMAQRRLTSEVNDFLVAVQYARSEATKQGTTVSVQSLDDTDGANEWGKAGYCVVVGNPGNCDNALRTFDATGSNTLNGQGVLDGLGTLSFNSRGLLIGAGAGTIDLCDPNEQKGRRVTLTLIGHVSSQEADCP